MQKYRKTFDVSNIKDPSFLKDLTYQELEYLSEDIASYIVDITSKNGGHLSSNLGVVDATVALCRVFDFSKDKIIFDVGHQCYTYKILTGRDLSSLRQKDGVSGFQRIHESKYDHFEAGHSSTSIAVANGFAIARDMNKEKYDCIAFIGDSSLANGLALESLNDIALQKHKVIVVLNDNGMSISAPVGGISKMFRKLSSSSFYIKSKRFTRKIFIFNKLGRKIYSIGVKIKNKLKRFLIRSNFFDILGLQYIGPIDGHDIKKLEKAFNKAKRHERSVVVHIKTIKGKRYKFAEVDKKGDWHGVCPFDKLTGKPLHHENHPTWGKLYTDYLCLEMRNNEKIVAIVPGTSLGSHVDYLYNDFPKRIIDVGIAEEYAITLAAGLSISSYHPVISIYSTFLQRGYDQISHDLSRVGLSATILIDRAGFNGNDGTSHQGIYDEAFLYSIPNVVIAMAANSKQAKQLLHESFNHHGVFAIRFSKNQCLEDGDEDVIEFGKWQKLIDSNGDDAIISVGPETNKLKKLLLEQKKDSVTLINAIYQYPLDGNCINSLLNKKKIIIYNAYATEIGFANALMSSFYSKGFKGEIIKRTIPNDYIHHATIHEQQEEHHLLPEDIIKLI